MTLAVSSSTLPKGRSLAEPNITVLNGMPASFLSGGQSAVLLNPDGSPFGTPVGPLDTTTRAVLADVTGDGVPDLVVGSGPGTAARVLVIDGATRQTVMTLTPFEDGFTGGTFVAAGEVFWGDDRLEDAITWVRHGTLRQSEKASRGDQMGTGTK